MWSLARLLSKPFAARTQLSLHVAEPTEGQIYQPAWASPLRSLGERLFSLDLPSSCIAGSLSDISIFLPRLQHLTLRLTEHSVSKFWGEDDGDDDDDDDDDVDDEDVGQGHALHDLHVENAVEGSDADEGKCASADEEEEEREAYSDSDKDESVAFKLLQSLTLRVLPGNGPFIFHCWSNNQVLALSKKYPLLQHVLLQGPIIKSLRSEDNSGGRPFLLPPHTRVSALPLLSSSGL